MSQQFHKARTWLTFVFTYSAVYLGAVLGAVRLFGRVLEPGWAYVLPFKNRLTAAVLICAPLSALVGTWTASVLVRTHMTFGRDAITSKQFFFRGWVGMMVGNGAVVIGSLRWALPREVGEPWVQTLGIERFNATTLLVVPSLAYVAGVFAVIWVESMIEAQRS